MRITKTHALSWQHLVLLGILAAALLGSYYLPDAARAELRADAGYAWGFLAMLLGPLVRRRVAEATAEKPDDDDKGAP